MQYAYTVEHQGQNTGWALAVSKGLKGQVELLVGKFTSTFNGKNVVFYTPKINFLGTAPPTA